MLKIATIGSGKIVLNMLETLSKTEGMAHEAIYSRTTQRAESFAAQCAVKRTFTSLDSLAAAEDIDAVYVASPNICHREQALRLIEGGKHVLVEKPAGICRADVAYMADAAARRGVVFMEAMRPVHTEGLKLVKSLLPRIGRVRRATLRFCQYSSRYDKFRGGVVENAFDPTLGNGALMDIGVYCVHAMEYLFGTPQSVCGHSVFLRTGVDGEGTILAGYEDMLCELIYSKIADSVVPSVIEGEEGSLIIDHLTRFTKVTLCPRGGEREDFSFTCPEGGDMVCELGDFRDCILALRTEREFTQHSLAAAGIMDSAREYMGIDFHAKA